MEFDISEALNQFKSAFDLLRSAVGLVSDVTKALPDGSEKEAATKSLLEAAKAAQIAEASVAQALGYELCKCAFPPTPMLRIGYRILRGAARKTEFVYECPKCKQHTAGGWQFMREIEEKEPPSKEK